MSVPAMVTTTMCNMKLSNVRRGFTLIELMIVVSIIGIIASIAIPAFLQYIRQTKTAESYTNLKAIADGASTYYTVDHYDNEGFPVSDKQFATTDGSLADTSESSLPANIPKGTKFAVGIGPWDNEPWASLNFQIIKPQYYRYGYKANNSPTAGDSFTGIAEGDLDADNDTSRFEIIGIANTSGDLVISPVIIAKDELE